MRCTRFMVCGLAAALLCGCGSQTDYMPSAVGTKWSYSIRTPYSQTIEEASILGRAAAGKSEGFIFSSPAGQSRMGWSDGQLVLARAGGTLFHPPLPILNPSLGEKKQQWTGQMIVNGVKRKASAELSQKKDTMEETGKTFQCLHSQIVIATSEGKMELETWWSRGTGIIRQEQRNDNEFVVAIEWINGPRTEKRN